VRATFRPLPAWPYPPSSPASVPFRMTWEQALGTLEREVEFLEGDDVVIGVVVEPSQIGMSGMLKAGGRAAVRHAGVEVSFEVPGGRRLTFHTNAYGELRQNVRAIAAGLEALRAVDRYGITSTAEQYAGFAALPSGAPDPERGRQLVERAGGVSAALKRHHPDHQGDPRDFADVQAYRELAGAGARS